MLVHTVMIAAVSSVSRRRDACGTEDVVGSPAQAAVWVDGQPISPRSANLALHRVGCRCQRSF